MSEDKTTEKEVTLLSAVKPALYSKLNYSSPFTNINGLTLRDLNRLRHSPIFSVYSKEDISRYLANPYRNEKQLREAVRYIYQASSHFRRIIQYFVGLTDLVYIVEPYDIDPKHASTNKVNLNYRKTLKMIDSMNIKTQLPKILTVCLREDVFYGTLWVTKDSITILQLPSDYCAISEIEGNVFNVSFNFSYFTANEDLLDFYPEEFRIKYEYYKNGERTRSSRWMTLDSPTSFAIKCNSDILEYAIPPFAGVLREIYAIEDYKQLKLAQTELENYALVSMRLPLNSDGEWGIDLNKAYDFWSNLESVLPDEVGSVLTPMPLEKISFEKSNTGDTETVSEAEESLFTASGVSSLLFNNEKASSNALLLSIKADQAITYGIVKSIEDALNRFLHTEPYGKNFKLNFLDISRFNRDEATASYLKACQFGIPMISYYCAASGLSQMSLDAMSFLEGKVLGLHEMFEPLRSSTQMSSSESDGEAGAPKKGLGEVSDSREANEEAEH